MAGQASMEREFQRWTKQFVADARADGCQELRRHIEYLELDCAPEAMLEATVQLVAAVIAYRVIDGRGAADFLRGQRYRLCGEGLPFYCVTFWLGPGRFGRVLVGPELAEVDFADLFDHPWYSWKTAGFNRFWISRLDGEPIEADEVEKLRSLILQDLYFDYGEDEVAADVFGTELDDTVRGYAMEPEPAAAEFMADED